MMPSSSAAAVRAAAIEALIPPPPADVAPLRIAFADMVARQWDVHVPVVLPFKARFIAGMYARACYSMLLVGGARPRPLSYLMRTAALLPQSRPLTIRLAAALLHALPRLIPHSVHRQMHRMSALMGLLDVVLDANAAGGDSAVLRIAASLTREARPEHADEQTLVQLTEAARSHESPWQAAHWTDVLQPAVREYCLAEARAVRHIPDPTGMGHRQAGIDAALSGMWYVVGPLMRPQPARERQWMADTSLLMQMIDDWVDQDEDRGARLTPAVTGVWTPPVAAALYQSTVRDLAAMLDANQIHSPVLQQLFTDLYTDYLHTAIEAMRSGAAA